MPEIYAYDEMPPAFRVQVVHIIKDALGFNTYHYNEAEKSYDFIHSSLCREYGLFTLGQSTNEASEFALLNNFLKTSDAERVIDIIEMSFKYIEVVIANDYQYASMAETKIRPAEAIEELNQRFKEHAIGYQFEAGNIMRVDSAYAHTEIVKPTITLLWSDTFKGANEEYLKAHEHYRHGRNKECLTECLKAFESTMKTICKKKGWTFNPTDAASKLLNVCFTNGLVPSFTQTQFTSLQSLLSSGIPTIRNKLSGHGQGQVPQSVDDGMTRYGLNLTGSSIIFLVEQSGVK